MTASAMLQQAAATAGAVALLAALLWRLVRPHVSLYVTSVVDRIGNDLSARVDALESSLEASQDTTTTQGRRLSTVERDLSAVVAELSSELVLYRALLQGAGVLPDRRRELHHQEEGLRHD